MKTVKYILILFLFFVFANGKEISAFDAGNINSQNPYGLTKSEKISFENSTKINSLSTKFDSLVTSNNDKINFLTNKVDSLNLKQDELFQKLEGISSLFESSGNNHNNLRLNVQNAETKLSELSNQIEANINKIEALGNKVDEFILIQKQNNKLQEESNSKLTSIINKINSEYVKKIEFNELVSYVNKNDNKPNTKSHGLKDYEFDKTIISEPILLKSQNKKQTNKDMFEDAVKLFKSKYITKALPMFEELVSEKYKLAETNFYIGEIKFKNRLYKEAIQFYKQSMIADDKANYIPELLLHSAVCFEHMKEYDNAQNFYKTIIDVYPKSIEAKEAFKKIKKGKIKNDKIK